MQQRLVANRYALLVELGRGAMGVVWRAQDQVLGRAVALKELHPPQGMAAAERTVLEERMLREARTAGRLNHPAVVTVYDIVHEHDRTYLAMELVDALDLASIVQKHGPRDSTWMAGVALQVLGALEAAHQAGIVHRDVKPSNIMVRPDGGVKLTDFGIAQAMDDPRLTHNGGIVGSPAYMSPDRLSGWEASPASDLWALGVTMAHAVEGVSPFERTSTASTLHAVMNEPPVLRRASPALADVIRGFLTVDLARRLTAPQARHMLTAIVQGGPPVPLPQNKKGKSTAVKVAAVAVGVAVLAGAAFAGYQAFKSEQSSAGQNTGTNQPSESSTEWTEAASLPVGAPLPSRRIATFGRGGDVPEWNLSGTQCAKDFLTQGSPVRTDVPCDGPHGIQLFSAATPLWDKPKDIAYPGTQWLADFTKNYCTEQFKVIEPNVKEPIGFTGLVPTQKEWEAYNDAAAPGRQEVLCVLWKQDRSPLAGSLVG
ncbi:serine/threonine-protein kinase [Lentzea flaviverrucosa]|uniref:non-specific serine/threonine protein kinase n=1 Tax=Lentzea flaviverrucosa TaxID=200379 RepID=A0A1H9TSA6_9PSEU|nr:serine/threonine-protein kinase [Lentzea flaviverrucosa]RDI33488.1 serine/threonine protein kinase [Lentzea flaviverrucosa]SES00115.1 Serine/threonine protein kinase [Lentzea flaviverrucosa]